MASYCCTGKTCIADAYIGKKGNDVAVHGRLAYRNYTDKNGVEKYVTEIIIHDFYKISKMNVDSESTKEEIHKEEVEVLPF